MMTWEECLAELPQEQQYWCEKIAELAGTTDADWQVFVAASQLLKTLR